VRDDNETVKIKVARVIASTQTQAYKEHWSQRKLSYVTYRKRFQELVETLDLVDASLDPYEIVADWRFQHYPWWSASAQAFEAGKSLLDQIFELAVLVRSEKESLRRVGYDYDSLLATGLAPKAEYYKKQLVALWRTRDKRADPPNEKAAVPPQEAKQC